MPSNYPHGLKPTIASTNFDKVVKRIGWFERSLIKSADTWILGPLDLAFMSAQDKVA